MKKLFLLLFLSFSLSAFSQTARQVLDNTAARFNTSGIKATFKATTYNGSTPEGETTGTMLMKGNMFKMTSSDMTAWYNGSTQWAMLAGSDEVNVTEPTAEEQAAINPAVLIRLYQHGYKMGLKKSTLRGKPTYVVTLVAQKSDNTLSPILLDIEQGSYTPYCIRAKVNGTWIRLVIQSFQTGQNFSDATFTFPKSEYPDVEIIDLR